MAASNDDLVKALEKARNEPLWRWALQYAWVSTVWFALPFLSLWALGVSPTAAAWTAVSLSILSAISFRICMVLYTWLVAAISVIAK